MMIDVQMMEERLAFIQESHTIFILYLYHDERCDDMLLCWLKRFLGAERFKLSVL